MIWYEMIWYSIYYFQHHTCTILYWDWREIETWETMVLNNLTSWHSRDEIRYPISHGCVIRNSYLAYLLPFSPILRSNKLLYWIESPIYFSDKHRTGQNTQNMARHEHDLYGWLYACHAILREYNEFWSYQNIYLFMTSSWQRDHFAYAPSQWETRLQRNVVSHWLGACK